MSVKTKDRYFVTGATGCIGAWTVKNLIESGEEVFVLVRSNLDKLKLIMSSEDIAKAHIINGDICDGALLERALVDNKITNVIHLAAMQLPLCRNNPILGAGVNVVGTVNMFEAVRKAGIKKLVYASSTAVYGYPSEYQGGMFTHDSPLIPHSLYGVYKVANESTAKVYFEELGISSIGIRPFVVYGPLRDQGMSSTPTTAMKMAVKGEPYEISYGGEFGFQYVDDTAKAFIRASVVEFQGAKVYNLGGSTVTMQEVIAAIEAVIPEATGLITYRNNALPFPRQAENNELTKLIGKVCGTPIIDGIRQSIALFRTHKASI